MSVSMDTQNHKITIAVWRSDRTVRQSWFLSTKWGPAISHSDFRTGGKHLYPLKQPCNPKNIILDFKVILLSVFLWFVIYNNLNLVFKMNFKFDFCCGLNGKCPLIIYHLVMLFGYGAYEEEYHCLLQSIHAPWCLCNSLYASSEHLNCIASQAFSHSVVHLVFFPSPMAFIIIYYLLNV